MSNANPNNGVDLSSSTVILIGTCFQTVFDQMNWRQIDKPHQLGIMLTEEFRRRGLKIERQRIPSFDIGVTQPLPMLLQQQAE